MITSEIKKPAAPYTAEDRFQASARQNAPGSHRAKSACDISIQYAKKYSKTRRFCQAHFIDKKSAFISCITARNKV